MKQRAIKMPDELWDAVQSEAAKVGLTAGEFVRLAVEEKLDLPEPQIVSEEHRHSAEQIASLAALPANPRVVTMTTAETVRARCTEKGCVWSTTSDTATPRCPQHGFGSVEFV